MKKIYIFIFIYCLFLTQSCFCPNYGYSITYITIERTKALFFSFNKSGLYPYLNEFDRNQLGLSIHADSSTYSTETAMNTHSFLNAALACDDGDETYYLNSIDSVEIITVYDFDSDHLAGANVNGLLDLMDIMGETHQIANLKELSFTSHYFKFNTSPTFDSMQFIVNGQLGEKGNFYNKTELVVLSD